MKICPQCSAEYEDNSKFCRRDGKTLVSKEKENDPASSPVSKATERIKHYEILEQQVGEETIVYKAWDPTFERHVAIKEPLPHLLKDRSFLDSFVEEGKRLANINDENVAKFYTLIAPGEVNDKCYLVMEYVGQSLEDLLKFGPLDIPTGRNILRDVLGGLKAIHKGSLVHANVQPGNILITPEKRAKISDLRIAWVRDQQSTVPISSAKYLPHEVLAGDGKLGPWSDLYSLGCVAYEMFLGTALFEAQFSTPVEKDLDAREIMDPRYREWHCDLSAKAKSLIKVDNRIPESLSTIVARLMEKDIAQRYQDAGQALRDLGSGRVVQEQRVAPEKTEFATGAKLTQAYVPEEKTRVAKPKDDATKIAPKGREPAESTFWQDVLIVFGVALMGLVIVAVMIKLS